MSREGSFGSLHARRLERAPRVIPLFLLIVGVVVLGAGILLLRRAGSGYRLGRLLAAAPNASLEEAAVLARENRSRYVRVHGRISSDEEFPDENDRPLVYRRRRIQARNGTGGWDDLEDDRVAVPFGLEDRQSFLAIDVDALGGGLVVVPRIASGTAAEVPVGTLSSEQNLAPETPVRLLIEQVSAVEHATACGVPVLDAAGAPALSVGQGRPLILTTLEPAAAMRLLASGKRGSMVLSAALLVAGLATIAASVGAWLVGA
jgi:hypothetical protein